jgi:hypothetical protein
VEDLQAWRFMSSVLTDEMIPEKAVGFVYIIENTKNGMKYIGKKLLTKAASKMVKGKRKKYRVASDWKEYWSSSPWLQEIIEAEGKENFTRKILVFCDTKGETNYAEETLQHRLRVLESDKWYNGNIRSRIFGKNVIKYSSLDRIGMVASIYS